MEPSMNLALPDYLSNAELKTLIAALLVLAVLMVISRLLLGLLRRLSRAFLFTRVLLKKVGSPLRWLIPLIGLQTVWTSAPDDVTFISPARHVTSLLIIAAFTWLGLRSIKAGEEVILLSNPVDMANNLRARQIQTQTRVLVRTLGFFVLLLGIATMLMTFPTARQFGTSLLASAGVAGLAVGFAAKPVLGNLIAGLQIALTQPIRLDDVVIVENEWGRIEEITGTFVIVRIWDERRMVVPLQWFIEHPFQNWTRVTSNLIGSVFFWVDYTIPLEPLRTQLDAVCKEVPELWDGRVSLLQVTDANERAIQLRILVSSADSSRNWDLRCYVREKLISFISREYPHCLPLLRADVSEENSGKGPMSLEERTAEPERQPPV
jgi:small-conductance mechanosensitive channel